MYIKIYSNYRYIKIYLSVKYAHIAFCNLVNLSEVNVPPIFLPHILTQEKNYSHHQCHLVTDTN